MGDGPILREKESERVFNIQIEILGRQYIAQSWDLTKEFCQFVTLRVSQFFCTGVQFMFGCGCKFISDVSVG